MPETTPGRSIAQAWPYLLLGCVLLGVGLTAWQPIPAGVWHDDGVYMLVGRSLGEGGGLRYAGVPGRPPAVKFPPGYPGLLGLLWLVFGTLGSVTLVAELLNLAFLAAAGPLLAWALVRSGVLSRNRALAVAALAFLSADLWRVALIPLSEPLFVALLAAALAAWKPAEDPERPGGWIPLACLLVALVLTREAGLAVVVGVGVALLWRRRVRRALAVVAPAAVVVIGWSIVAGRQARAIPPTLRDLLGPYGGWLEAETLGAPIAFLRGLPHQLLGVVGEVVSFLVPGAHGNAIWVAAVPLVAVALVGIFRLARLFPPIPWILGAYLAMVTLWPYLDRRLAVPVHPLVVVALAVGALDLLRYARARGPRVALVAAAFVWVAAYSTVSAGRISRGWPANPYRVRAQRLATAVEALQRTVGPDAVVGAPEFWAALHLHGGWEVVPSARFAPRTDDGSVPVWGTPRQQLETWWAAGVDHVLLEQGGEIHGEALNLLESHCPGAVHVLARMPPQLLVRLDWGTECAVALGLDGSRTGGSAAPGSG